MAATFTLTKVADYVVGNRKVRVRDVAVSGTYTAAGGDSLLPSAFGLRVIQEFLIHDTHGHTATLGYPATYVYSTNKLKFWEMAAGANLGLANKGNGEALTDIAFRVTVVGY